MRITDEKDYWNKAALDPDVDKKFICNLPDDSFQQALGSLSGRVLEIGCGVGRLMKPGYCGVDISEEMLKIAAERRPECEFEMTDGRSLPYPNNVFDSAYCVLVFQHLPEEGVKAYLSEAHRVLKEYGLFRFQFVEGHEHEPFSHRYSLDEMKSWTKQAGFMVSQVDEKLVHPQWVWITAIK